jgi:hypothetical protein
MYRLELISLTLARKHFQDRKVAKHQICRPLIINYLRSSAGKARLFYQRDRCSIKINYLKIVKYNLPLITKFAAR